MVAARTAVIWSACGGSEEISRGLTSLILHSVESASGSLAGLNAEIGSLSHVDVLRDAFA